MDEQQSEPQIVERPEGHTWRQQLNTVTPASKYLSIMLFVILPFVGFLLGYLQGLQDAAPAAPCPLCPGGTNAASESSAVTKLIMKECIARGGEVVNTLGGIPKEYADAENMGKLTDARCPCVCLVTQTDGAADAASLIDQHTAEGEVRFQGMVLPGGQHNCQVDGVCSIMAGEYEVEWAHGWPQEPVGTMNNDIQIGDLVDVYGKVVSEKYVTIYGSEEYYVRHAEVRNNARDQE